MTIECQAHRAMNWQGEVHSETQPLLHIHSTLLSRPVWEVIPFIPLYLVARCLLLQLSPSSGLTKKRNTENFLF